MPLTQNILAVSRDIGRDLRGRSLLRGKDPGPVRLCAFFRSPPLRSYRDQLEKTSRNPAAMRRDAGISIGDELPRC